MVRALALTFILWLAAAAAPPPGEGYVEVEDGLRLYYDVVGRGETVLLVVHGGPGNSHMSVRPDFAPLEQHYTLVYYDQRGNGRSSLIADPLRLAIDHHVRDLEAVRRHFGLERVNLLGNSWGGLLAAVYASEHPDRIGRLLLHSPAPPTFAWLAEMGESMDGRARRLYSGERLRRLSLGFDPAARARASDPVALCREWASLLLPLMAARPESGARVRGDLCFGPPRAVATQQIVNGHVWSSLPDYDLRGRMGVVTAPMLVIHGAADNIPLAASRAWAESVPNGRLLVVAEAGHIQQAETPALFFDAVRRFFDGGWPEGAEPVRPD